VSTQATQFGDAFQSDMPEDHDRGSWSLIEQRQRASGAGRKQADQFVIE
jgi:hypothetical protein